MLSGEIECPECGTEMSAQEPKKTSGKGKKKTRWRKCSNCGKVQRLLRNGRRPKVAWRRIPACSS